MDIPHEEDLMSDDEIFFGKLSLKEFKKHILWDKKRQMSPCVARIITEQEDHDKSLKLIETHSQPNLLSTWDPLFPTTPITPAKSCDWDNNVSDDSFINMENMVEKLCMSPGQRETTELNNTLEVIEYILKNGPPKPETVPENKEIVKTNYSPKKVFKSECDIDTESFKLLSKCHTVDVKAENCHTLDDKVDSCHNWDVKADNGIPDALPQSYVTPAKARDQLCDDFGTPLPEMKPIRQLFKTPAQPKSHKKPLASSLKKTPCKSNVYQHITSPIASYINQSPQVPLVKDVHPRKPLPCSSSIPKLQKSTVKPKLSNKESIVFPSIAYKSAIKTKVINVPDKEKLPQSQWVKKITSSLPRPVVMKHDQREHNHAMKPLKPQEDSFADLSYHQADVSICTQKSAFKLNKHF